MKKGDTVLVKRPVRLEAKAFSSASGIETQDLVEEAVEVKLDTIASVDVELTAIESACDMDSMTRLFLEPAAAALAEKINADGLMLYRDVRQNCGIAGTPPDTLSAFANASPASGREQGADRLSIRGMESARGVPSEADSGGGICGGVRFLEGTAHGEHRQGIWSGELYESGGGLSRVRHAV